MQRERFNDPGDSGGVCRYDGEVALNSRILGMVFAEAESVDGTLVDAGFIHDCGELPDRIKEKWGLGLALK